MTLRVLMAHNRYQISSGEDAVFDAEVDLLRRNSIEVESVEASNRGIRSPWELSQSGYGIWSSIWHERIRDAIRSFRPDVAHFHNTHPVLTPSVFSACVELHVPVVLTLHNYRLVCPAAVLFRDGKTCEQCLRR